MENQINVKITGVEDIKTILNKLNKSIVDEIKKYVKSKSETAKKEVVKNITSDNLIWATKALKNSIKVEIESDGLSCKIGSSVEYAIYVEFGVNTFAPFIYKAFWYSFD